VSSKRQSFTQQIATIPAVILAAGKGTRMQAAEPKAAVRVGGKPMAARVAEAMRGAGITRIVAVLGHRAEDVRAAIGSGVEYVVQEEQLGTGHAARCAQIALQDYQGPLVIAYADIPLLTKEDITRLLTRHLLSAPAATMLTAVLAQPGTLGRILRGPEGNVMGIIEARDANEEQLKINEINVGVYCFETPTIFDILTKLRNENAQGQYYLTDAIGILVERGDRVEAVPLQEAHNGMGVDTLEDLQRAQQLSGSGRAR
jgi:bifunctional UDP-N-acetylglucosamine pyrophosphorylase/glucosamine-1-phosphate N-acetyltransferase